MKNLEVHVKPGKYVLAVSGGVDSMTLLDMLAKKSELELVVAHFNHGIRSDSPQDEKLVAEEAKRRGLAVELGRAKLGSGASEDAARQARYKFLEQVREKNRADSIITAHQQDDLIETAIINILRGTGRRGLSAIADNPLVKRPLLGISKADILKYAKARHLKWHEDSTNVEDKYLRNYIRKEIVSKMSQPKRQAFIKNLDKIAKSNKTMNSIIATISQALVKDGKINRHQFTMLPNDVAREEVMYLLRDLDVRQYDKKTIERLVLAIKTAKAGTQHNVRQDLRLVIDERRAFFSRTE